MERPAMVEPKAPSPTPESFGIAGAPGALATCRANIAADWCANIATAAVSVAVAPVYSQTIPPPPADLWVGPLSETPSAVLAWAKVGQVAVPVGTAGGVVVLAGAALVAEGVVAEGAVVGDDVEVALGVLLLQAVRTRPTIKTPATKGTRLFIV